jgi:hypothetical protein
MPNMAIIVGISAYPELTPKLEGPATDAEEFRTWVTTHGGVKPEDARLIQAPNPQADTALNARPTSDQVKYEFDRIEVEARKPGAGGRAGDRLYLYLAGHGFGQDLDAAALLMANATQSVTGHHIPGRPWANHFYSHNYFREVLLFIDCCRERYQTTALNGPGRGNGTPDPGARRFYGFATKYGRLSVERPFGNRMRGVFTMTLLDGLNGGAAESNGHITGESLKAYLYENMKEYLTPADLANRDIAQEPDLYCDPPERQFVIATVPQTRHAVTIGLPAGSEAKPRTLIGDDGVSRRAVLATEPGNGTLTWALTLPWGLYGLEIGGDKYVLTVTGRGTTRVTPA